MSITTPLPVTGQTILKEWGGAVVADLTDLDTRVSVDLRGQIVRRGRRVTNSTASGSEQEVLRVDSIPVIAGRAYHIVANPMVIDTSVANDIGRILLRIDETGANATVSSTLIALGQQRLADAANGNTIQAAVSRLASVDGTWSVLLSTSRVSGTGLISVNGASTNPIELLIFDCGIDPGDTGVDL